MKFFRTRPEVTFADWVLMRLTTWESVSAGFQIDLISSGVLLYYHSCFWNFQSTIKVLMSNR